jgi:hypothetical protein
VSLNTSVAVGGSVTLPGVVNFTAIGFDKEPRDVFVRVDITIPEEGGNLTRTIRVQSPPG